MGMETRTYENLNMSRVMWICNACGVPNYSACHFFSSIETSNSFSSLPSLNGEGAILGSPRAASTPVDKESNTTPFTSSKKGSKVGSLRILVINCQSVKAKRESLHTCIEMNKPHIIIGTESWLNEAISNNEIFPSDFNAYRKDRVSNISRGGVFVTIRNDLICTHQIELDTDCEIIWVRIQLLGCKDLLVGAFYRVPDNKDLGYLENLRSSLTRINTSKGTTVCLGGDFNLGDINWETLSVPPGSSKKAMSEFMIEIADQFDLDQMVTKPTREDRILDLFLTNNPSLVQKSAVIPGISDHDGIPMIDMLTHPKLIKTKPRKIYRFNKANVEGLKKDLSSLSSKILSKKGSTVEADWSDIKNDIIDCMDTHIPFKYSSKKNSSPWITPRIKRRLRQKQRAFNRARATRKEADKQKFRDLRKAVQKETKNSYWNWVRTSCIESPKQFWSFVKKLRKDSVGIPALKSCDELISDSNGKAEILNQQFESVFTNEDPLVNIPSQHVFPTMPDFVIAQEGVLKLLNGLDENKAPGPDGVSAKILKSYATELTPALTHIFNKSLSSGDLPSDWLLANITPIFKKGDRATASNYRPVSLTPIRCKVFEHIVHSRTSCVILVNIKSSQTVSMASDLSILASRS